MSHLPTQDASVPPMEAALPVLIVSGLNTGESTDLIQEPIGDSSAASAGDNEPATEIDGVKAGMSPVDDAAVTTMTTVVDANPANLVEEPSRETASNVDTVTQSSATKSDESATADVVAELSNADANLVEEPIADATSNVDVVAQEPSAVAVAELSNADANLVEEPTADATSNVDAVAQEPSAVAVAELSNANANLVEEPRADATSNVDAVAQEPSAVAVAELSNADANLVEEPRADATSKVDAVAQEPSAVAVAELSNADANLVEEPRADATSNADAVAQEPSAVAVAELSNANANTIAVGPAKGDVPSKEDEAVTETVPADNQDSAKIGEIPVDYQGSTIAEAKEEHPTDKVESAVSKVRELTLFKSFSCSRQKTFHNSGLFPVAITLDNNNHFLKPQAYIFE